MSKMKQHLEKEIVIEGSRHEEMSWKRYIYFQYEGNNYELTLFWEEFNGYDTFWRVPDRTPDWVAEWDSVADKVKELRSIADKMMKQNALYCLDIHALAVDISEGLNLEE